MRPYIQSKGRIPGGINFFNAYQGFTEMGLECVLFEDVETLDTSLRSDVVVGGLGVVQHALTRFGAAPGLVDYPEELSAYMGRRVWTSTLDEVRTRVDDWPVFVKPLDDEKRFTGVVVRGAKDLVGRGACGYNPKVLCSATNEWRAFHLGGTLLNLCRNSNQPAIAPRPPEGLVSSFENLGSPYYTVDFAERTDGNWIVVETGDGQVSGLAAAQDPAIYYQVLADFFERMY